MIEKCKEYLKRNFSNSPKAKIMLTVVTILIVTITVVGLRKTITVDIDGKEHVFVTYNRTVEDVLRNTGVQLAPKDKVQPALSERVPNKGTIEIKRAVDVQFIAKDKKIIIQTAEDTVKDMLVAEKEALKSQGIEFVEGVDEITPALATEIKKDLNIQLVKVEEVKEVASEAINFDVITQEDSNLDISVKEVKQDGVVGEKEITYKIVKKDGKEVSRDIVSSKVIKEPVNKIVVEGTRRTFASRDGEILDYKKLIYCESTAYYGDGITATGTVPVYNPGGISTIAVDPRVIPLGSLVYVKGYGKAIAADTGGAIKGNIVDVFVDSYEAAYNDWGRRYDVPVYILAYPGEW